MNIQVSGFDWDSANRTKCQKHGVTFAEIEALFQHGPRIAPDPVTARYMQTKEVEAYEKESSTPEKR
jgi:uncharacterized DUF497 family protein